MTTVTRAHAEQEQEQKLLMSKTNMHESLRVDKDRNFGSKNASRYLIKDYRKGPKTPPAAWQASQGKNEGQR